MVRVGTTHKNVLKRGRTTSQGHGWKRIGRAQYRKNKGRSSNFHPDQLRANSPVNVNYCVKTSQTGLLARRKLPMSGKTMNSHFTKTLVNPFAVNPVLTAITKERHKSRCVRLLSRKQIKICERCFLCQSIVFSQTCNKCPTCCLRFSCRGQTPKHLANLAGSGSRSESSSNPQSGLHPPLLDLAELNKVTNHHKRLCQSL